MDKRYFGLIGILGSVLLFSGDMLLYGHFGSADEFYGNIQILAQNESQLRLFVGGLAGPLGAMLCVAGFWHIYVNIKRYSPSTALIIFFSLTGMMFFGGAFHTLWAVRMLIFKYLLLSIDNANIFITSFNSYLNTTFIISVMIGCIGGLLMIILILFRKSPYPRWVVFTNPGILLLLTPLIKRIPSPAGLIIYGGYLNIVFIIFFTCSVIITWGKSTSPTTTG